MADARGVDKVAARAEQRLVAERSTSDHVKVLPDGTAILIA